jgi:hypothetical protein
MSTPSSGIKILLLDIETTPNLVYTWGLFKQYVSLEQIVTPSTVLCFSAKWLGNSKIEFYSSKKDGFIKMIREAHRLLNEADAVVHYNGEAFDVPILNQEFLKAGLPPPAPACQIDLFKTVIKNFRTVSSKLAFIGPYLKIGEKVIHAGFSLWPGCMKGDKKCWDKMEEYNRGDVRLLEPLYKKLLPWIKNHPNVGMYGTFGDRPTCPNCGSNKLYKRGFVRNVTYTYQRYLCLDCGRWMQSRQSIRLALKPELKGIR